MSFDCSTEMECGNFRCVPLSSNTHRVHLFRFEVLEVLDEYGVSKTPKGLQNSINNRIAEMDSRNLLKTYLVYAKHYNSDLNKDIEELAFVFCLRSSSMNFTERNNSISMNEIIPAVELVYFAAEKNYREKHPSTKGLGLFVYDNFLTPIVQQIAKLVGCKNLYLFAINDKTLVDYYCDKLMFESLPEELEDAVVNNLVTEDNEKCKFLYQQIEYM